MDNIFEGAKFGDKFVTRDGRVALYLNSFEYNPEELDNIPNMILYELIVSDNLIITVNSEGIDDFINNIECNNDIVSRYQEPIDEDKLDELADEYINVINKGIFDDNYIPKYLTFKDINRCIKAGFINGYRKANKE